MSDTPACLLEHVRFSFTLELLSDAHIGDGGEAEMPVPAAVRDRGDPIPRFATLCRDHAGRPTLPATGLKGALRKALTPVWPEETIDRLFGKAETGDSGRFTFFAGLWQPPKTSMTDHLPHWSEQDGRWIATHVALSRQTGAADPMKLYNQELIPAGSQFAISGIWFGPKEEAERDLPDLLQPLACEDGLSLGAGGRQGLGAACLTDPKAVTLRSTRFDPPSGDVVTEGPGTTIPVRGTASVAPTARLSFHCEGPFASADYADRPGDNRRNVIRALRRNEAMPVLHGETVAGALRQRAAWLALINDPDGTKGLSGDDRFLPPSGWACPTELSAVQRLFGVAGWRGLLRQTRPKALRAAQSDELTSIALDRFSGAVLDGALFSQEVFIDVRFHLDLTLDTLRWAGNTQLPTAKDRDLLKLLLDDLDGDVLMLGHGTNRGFGWFTVTIETCGEGGTR